jgi:hypothetical protein
MPTPVRLPSTRLPEQLLTQLQHPHSNFAVMARFSLTIKPSCCCYACTCAFTVHAFADR